MGLVRQVTLLYEDGRGGVMSHCVLVPAEAFAGDVPARVELTRPEVRMHFDIDAERVFAVEIGPVFDPATTLAFSIE